jgi:hypothetical protein
MTPTLTSQAEEDARIVAILSSETYPEARLKLVAQGFPVGIETLRRWGQRHGYKPQGPKAALAARLRSSEAALRDVAGLLDPSHPGTQRIAQHFGGQP